MSSNLKPLQPSMLPDSTNVPSPATEPTANATSNDGATLDDIGLRCLDCDYNLTGIHSERCPECGRVLDWEAVQRFADEQNRLEPPWWERSNWPWKPVALFGTSLEVAFQPWKFAQRISSRPRLIGAASFLLTYQTLGICWALWKGVYETGLFAWVIGVACHILLQTVVFGLALRPWRVERAFQFWFVVSAYTSYPLLIVGELSPPYITREHSSIWPFSYLGSQSGEPFISSLYYVWLIGLTIIAYTRLPKNRRWRSLLVLVLIPTMTFICSHIGIHFGDLLGRVI